jgi:hypothetical protein
LYYAGSLAWDLLKSMIWVLEAFDAEVSQKMMESLGHSESDLLRGITDLMRAARFIIPGLQNCQPYAMVIGKLR